MTSTPPALLVSGALGGLGVLLLTVGAVVGAQAFFVAAVVAASLSLGSALYWRSQLINAWKQDPEREVPARRARTGRPTSRRR